MSSEKLERPVCELNRFAWAETTNQHDRVTYYRITDPTIPLSLHLKISKTIYLSVRLERRVVVQIVMSVKVEKVIVFVWTKILR